jgi:hypothetical protein
MKIPVNVEFAAFAVVPQGEDDTVHAPLLCTDADHAERLARSHAEHFHIPADVVPVTITVRRAR